MKLENFRSLNRDVPSTIVDANNLTAMIGIEDRNCVDMFSAIIFVSDILLRKYKDERTLIKSIFRDSDTTKPIKISLGLTLNTNELDRISDFIISAEIPLIRNQNDQHVSNLKIEILRKCARKQLHKLFANPLLEVIAQNPEFYQDDYVSIRLKIELGLDNFFVIEFPGSGNTMISKDQHLVRNYNTMTFADLLFNYLTNMNPILKDSTHMAENTVHDCESLDVFDILNISLDCRKYIRILTVPAPHHAGQIFKDRPELIAFSDYILKSDIKLTYGSNVTFLDLIRAIYMNFANDTRLRSQLAYDNWGKLVLERIDPSLDLLRNWISGRGSKSSKDFERGISLLLSLCGYRTLHVGCDYENVTQGVRQKLYGRAPVGIDIIVFSSDNKELLLCQCCTVWKDVKVNDILTISSQLGSDLLGLKDAPILHAAVVTCDSKSNVPSNIIIPNQVKIIDITDLITLLDEIKKGIVPYGLAKTLFI